MTEIGEVSVRKRRSRQEIKRLVGEFETSGSRRSEFCHKHNLALGTLQRGLRRRRMEVKGLIRILVAASPVPAGIFKLLSPAPALDAVWRLLLWTSVYRVIKSAVVHRITPD